MSTGMRVTLADAQSVIAKLREKWQLSPDVLVVGSVRRQRPDIGDIDLLAPQEASTLDTLYDRISATMQPEESALFAQQRDIIGEARRGLKPGFTACDLVIWPYDGVAMRVQIHRYTEHNLGWLQIMRTGPGDFGQWFLGKWKHAHDIPTGDPRYQASRDGYLIDRNQSIVPVRDELEAFRLAKLAYIRPEHRDSHMQDVPARRERRTS